VNEEDYLACTRVQPMLQHLEGRISDRKWRLFACALARRWWPQLLNARLRRAVEVAERFADGHAGEQELAEARGHVEPVVMAASEFVAPAYLAALAAAGESAAEAARAAAEASRRMAWSEAAYEGVPGADEERVVAAATAAETRAQCDLLRHIAGNPFRPAAAPAAWLAANGGAVAKIARVIYDHGRREDFPILADALLDAGCTDEEWLAHCHTHDHPRGCWLLDTLLRQR
jgi:hypothetical protein